LHRHGDGLTLLGLDDTPGLVHVIRQLLPFGVDLIHINAAGSGSAY
jgi:hypothetical protein